jgi:hypothetical protein
VNGGRYEGEESYERGEDYILVVGYFSVFFGGGLVNHYMGHQVVGGFGHGG